MWTLTQSIAREETSVTSNERLPADGAEALSYYDQIGGAPIVKEAVDRFYRLVLDDVELAPYFTAIDVAQLKAHQVRLLSHVLGGPNEYQGRELATAHGELGITQTHYNKVGDYLTGVLTTMGAGEEIVAAVGATLAGVQSQIVAKADDAATVGPGGAA
jgi:hemoglobin